MKVRATTGYSLVDDDGREFPTEFQPVEWLDPFVRENDDGSVTIRYAVQDNDPMAHEWQEGVEFLLFNSGYERDQWISEGPDYCEDCGGYKAQHNEDGSDFLDDWGDTIDGHEFRPRTEWTDRMFWVERYEHGLVNYALMGESSQVDRRWDVAGGVAVLTVPDDVTDPEAFARSVLEEYTDWCNGDVYGVCEQTYAMDQQDPTKQVDWVSIDEETCWGFIGQSYTESVLKERL
jgi:hypothetical protein